MDDPIIELQFSLENDEPKVFKIYTTTDVEEKEEEINENENEIEPWRHDHGDLLPPRTPKVGVDLLKALIAAKHESDSYLTSMLGKETSSSSSTTTNTTTVLSKGSKRPLEK